MKKLIAPETQEQLLDQNVREYAGRQALAIGKPPVLELTVDSLPGMGEEAPNQLNPMLDLTFGGVSYLGGGWNLHLTFSTNDPAVHSIVRGALMGRDNVGVYPAPFRQKGVTALIDSIVSKCWDEVDGELYLARLLNITPEMFNELRGIPHEQRLSTIRSRMPHIQTVWDRWYGDALTAYQGLANG